MCFSVAAVVLIVVVIVLLLLLLLLLFFVVVVVVILVVSIVLVVVIVVFIVAVIVVVIVVVVLAIVVDISLWRCKLSISFLAVLCKSWNQTPVRLLMEDERYFMRVTSCSSRSDSIVMLFPLFPPEHLLVTSMIYGGFRLNNE